MSNSQLNSSQLDSSTEPPSSKPNSQSPDGVVTDDLAFEAPNYTQIPNKLFSLIPYMSDAELRVTLIIARETLGWHRKWSREPGARDQSSVFGLCARGLMELTGLSKPTVTKGIREGMKRGTIQRKGAGDSFIYCLKIAAMTPPDSDGAGDDLAFDEESLTDELGASGESAEEADRGKDSFLGKNVTGQIIYPRRVNNLPPTGQKSLPVGGKNLSPHHEEERKEINKTHTNKQAPASPAPVGVCADEAGSTGIGRKELLAYARDPDAGRGIQNIEAWIARRLEDHKADDAVREWLAGENGPDISQCPDCKNSSGWYYPNGIGNGPVARCKHKSLLACAS